MKEFNLFQCFSPAQLNTQNEYLDGGALGGVPPLLSFFQCFSPSPIKYTK